MSYARQRDVTRILKAIRDAGVAVGGCECLPDGTIRVLAPTAPKESTSDEAWEKWTAADVARRASGQV